MKRRKEKILIYGGSGLVGSTLVEKLSQIFDIKAPTHLDVDLQNTKQIQENIALVNPDQIIYAAGITKIDQAEQKPELAFLLNAEAPKVIADIATSCHVPLHYLSTNAVFDGQRAERPYREDDQPSPTSVYGKSKVKGEEYVKEASSKNTVLRMVMPYSTFYPRKKDFIRIVLESLQQGEKTMGIVDQIISPVYVGTVADAMKRIVMERPSGTYHLSATDWASNLEVAKKIANVFNFSGIEIVPTTLKMFYKDRPGERASYYWLDTKKFNRDFGEKILHTIHKDLALFKRDYAIFHTNTNIHTSEAISKI